MKWFCLNNVIIHDDGTESYPEDRWVENTEYTYSPGDEGFCYYDGYEVVVVEANSLEEAKKKATIIAEEWYRTWG